MLLMLVVDSLHLIFARALAEFMAPAHSSFFVLLIATVQMAFYLLVTKKFQWQLFKQQLWFFLSIGFLVAAATLASYSSVKLLDAGTASLLGRISTVITLALSIFWLKERFSRFELIGAVVCIVGAFTISFQQSDVLKLGSLLILLSVSCYSLHIAIVKRFGDSMDFANFFFWRIASTTFFLGLMGLGQPLEISPSPQAWLILLLTASIDVVLSRLLYYWMLRKMRLGIHTILLTVTPLLTVFWSIVFFAERPSFQTIIGGLLIIMGVVVVAEVQRQRGLSS